MPGYGGGTSGDSADAEYSLWCILKSDCILGCLQAGSEKGPIDIIGDIQVFAVGSKGEAVRNSFGSILLVGQHRPLIDEESEKHLSSREHIRSLVAC